MVATVVEERKGGAREGLKESSVGEDRTCRCTGDAGATVSRDALRHGGNRRGRVGMSATRSTARGRAMQVVPP